MQSEDVDTERILTPALYILCKLNNSTTKHKLFKILYFADKEHIAKYGQSFLEDNYIRMDFGPVPSKIFDYIRILEGTYRYDYTPQTKEAISALISVDGKNVLLKTSPDLKFLSPSAIKFLDKSIAKYRGWFFGALRDLSHDAAWHSAPKNGKMSIIDIAKAAGANEAMIAYIKETM